MPSVNQTCLPPSKSSSSSSLLLLPQEIRDNIYNRLADDDEDPEYPQFFKTLRLLWGVNRQLNKEGSELFYKYFVLKIYVNNNDHGAEDNSAALLQMPENVRRSLRHLRISMPAQEPLEENGQEAFSNDLIDFIRHGLSLEGLKVVYHVLDNKYIPQPPLIPHAPLCDLLRRGRDFNTCCTLTLCVNFSPYTWSAQNRKWESLCKSLSTLVAQGCSLRHVEIYVPYPRIPGMASQYFSKEEVEKMFGIASWVEPLFFDEPYWLGVGRSDFDETSWMRALLNIEGLDDVRLLLGSRPWPNPKRERAIEDFLKELQQRVKAKLLTQREGLAKQDSLPGMGTSTLSCNCARNKKERLDWDEF
ncbi:hypothetical protein MMC20_004836 [Loxospora ochrophaea]|nr:hypothetical protein [Loxospora ochrophaea]